MTVSESKKNTLNSSNKTYCMTSFGDCVNFNNNDDQKKHIN